MKIIKLKTTDIETEEVPTEFVNWVCPECGKIQRTIEWNIENEELWCLKCEIAFKISWENINGGFE